ncbi:MmgE/PrpD family protein [Sphaerotilus montanus]|uniref:2-methylcitrate dehydratase PrpD n=1 Tax=Sphaerotilus montanus TaxID=522889 RepID=A0A7Y9UDY8_9BURK|nr:MmgE/PrpD family protein [Sphaerotilus montanus]NYG35084.1 2-methylcitrate dehydratase PrpD [Sphaerotilus montanus]NZD56060.1 MmgE/PrpD family protein [Sphaerotilus montanus]
MKVTELFARFAAQLAQQALPDDVVHHAQRAVIDWHASLYPGLDMPAVRVLEATLAEDLDRGPARLARGRAATTRAAALLNGTAAHAAEVDDSFRDAMVHPGAATIAAALAVAQANGAHGAEFLRAVVVGYEVSTRIGVVMGRPHYRHWHNTGTMGSFGAAAAAASLLRLNEVAFAHALALAGTFTAGLQQAFRTEAMAKPLHAGRAAEAGVLAAQLAAKGMRSSLDVLEGASGLGQAMSDGPDWSQVDATLGDDFHITRLTFKNHIGCGHTFAAIDGALALQAQHGFRHTDIASVHLGVYQATLDIAPHVEPQTADQARFSLHYMVASALVHGSVRLSAFEPDRLNDPATRALMQRIRKSLDPEVDAGFPARRAARVVITLHDGRCLSHLQPDRKGDPELPLSDADLEGKLLELAGPVIGDAAARTLLAHLWTLNTSETLP